MRRLALMACMLSCATPASAHEFWIDCSSLAPAPGQVVRIGTIAGTGFRGERKPWSSARCVRFVARTARTLDLAPLGRSGETAWASFAPSDAGGALLAYQSTFTPIELPGPEFDSYLRLEGLDGPLAARRRSAVRSSGRERYRRCAKAWLAGSDAARATKPIGTPLEIVPLAMPGAGTALPVRLLWQGRPLANARLRAWRAPLGVDAATADVERRDSVAVAWQGRTGPHGEVLVPTDRDGEWLLSAVHMVPCDDRRIADWESTWASLTFARRGANR